MKELELTSNAALTDAVYETALNGSFLEVKLVAGSVGDDEPRGMQPEYECYHISYPDKKDTILFEQPLDAADDKVTVYDLGKKIKSIEGCCHKTLTKGESRTATARKVVAHGPMWIYVAIAVGMELNSTCKCNRILINNLFKFFVWREVSKSFTRSIIEFIFNPLNLFVGYFTKVLTLWDILPDKPVGVFIGTTFP